jgi:glycosyltransferase involved in cell wall biosynthesis
LHNESGNVQPLVTQIAAAMEKAGQAFEIILVDDASSDDTWSKVKEVCTGDGRVQGIRHLRNAGQSAALWTGFRHSRGQIIATLDGDLQNDPADFPRMLEELKTCDMVCGWRTRRADNFQRRISSKVARTARKLVLGVDFADTGCNLRVFKRELIDHLPIFNGLHRFMPVLAQGLGAKVKEIPVQHHPRHSGVSNYGLRNRLFRGIRDLLMVRWYLRRQIPRLQVERFSGDASAMTPTPETKANTGRTAEVAPVEFSEATNR